jgi:hypothetical protein
MPSATMIAESHDCNQYAIRVQTQYRTEWTVAMVTIHINRLAYCCHGNSFDPHTFILIIISYIILLEGMHELSAIQAIFLTVVVLTTYMDTCLALSKTRVRVSSWQLALFYLIQIILISMYNKGKQRRHNT